MKMLTSAELDTIMQTEFQRGFEACRAAAVKLCREQVEREAGYGGQWEGYGAMKGVKTGPECSNEIARLPVPRFKPK